MAGNTNRSTAQAEYQLDKVFSALGDSTRRALLDQLAEGPARITALASNYEISLPAVSKHIRVLEDAGLIDREICGRVHRCSLNAVPLKGANQWLEYYRSFWGGVLNRLHSRFDNDDTGP